MSFFTDATRLLALIDQEIKAYAFYSRQVRDDSLPIPKTVSFCEKVASAIQEIKNKYPRVAIKDNEKLLALISQLPITMQIRLKPTLDDMLFSCHCAILLREKAPDDFVTKLRQVISLDFFGKYIGRKFNHTQTGERAICLLALSRDTSKKGHDFRQFLLTMRDDRRLFGNFLFRSVCGVPLLLAQFEKNSLLRAFALASPLNVNLTSLPQEMLQEILKYADMNDAINLMQTSHVLRAAVMNNPALWQRFHTQYFPYDPVGEGFAFFGDFKRAHYEAKQAKAMQLVNTLDRLIAKMAPYSNGLDWYRDRYLNVSILFHAMKDAVLEKAKTWELSRITFRYDFVKDKLLPDVKTHQVVKDLILKFMTPGRALVSQMIVEKMGISLKACNKIAGLIEAYNESGPLGDIKRARVREQCYKFKIFQPSPSPLSSPESAAAGASPHDQLPSVKRQAIVRWLKGMRQSGQDYTQQDEEQKSPPRSPRL